VLGASPRLRRGQAVEHEPTRRQLRDHGGQVGKARRVVRMLWREINRTPAPPLCASIRHPSSLRSYTQPERWNGARASVGCIGTSAGTTGSQYPARVNVSDLEKAGQPRPVRRLDFLPEHRGRAATKGQCGPS
jgi:hypothetical protein